MNDYKNTLFIIDTYNSNHTYNSNQNICSIIEYENALCEIFENDDISIDIKQTILDKYNLKLKKDKLSKASVHLMDKNDTILVSLYDISKTILKNLIID